MKKVVFSMLLVIMGVIGVCAATQTVATKSISVTSGGAVTYTNLSASYDTARVMADPTSITSGTKKQKFIGYLNSSGTLTNKKSATGTLYTNACTLVTIGTIGKGKWYIVDQAFDGSTDYAGWSGTLTIQSVS